MSTQISIENFEKIYEATYEQVLKYIICKCSNLEDVNDLLQNTYIELYRILKKKNDFIIDNISAFIIGIAKKKIQKHYGILYKLKTISVFSQIEEEEYIVEIPDLTDLENEVVLKLQAEKVWQYIKKKETKTIKVFYLYYCLGLKLSEIAKELNIKESNVKNILYRTLKEIRQNLKIEGDENV